jgi:putative two-component system response regulator
MTIDIRILVVDDDRFQVDFISSILMGAGYKVWSASNGQAALDIVKSTPLDLVIADIIMDGMDGFELAKNVKALGDVPVMLLTGLKEEDAVVRGLSSGADEYVTKPFMREELLLRVHNILQYKKSQNLLESMVSKSIKQLTDALKGNGTLNREMVLRLLSATEMRDDETGTHIVRVSKFSCFIAAEYGFKGELLDLLDVAATMHDLGKVGIPDNILRKPGKLSTEEFDVMKKHTTIGASILEDSTFPLLNMSCSIAMSHHERWDGAGYPKGLKGRDIPIFGRIVAIADVFDALISKRVYKAAYSFERSVDIVGESSGKQFDPALVEAFMNIVDDIYKISKTWSK